jgi:hypothetical protein
MAKKIEVWEDSAGTLHKTEAAAKLADNLWALRELIQEIPNFEDGNGSECCTFDDLEMTLLSKAAKFRDVLDKIAKE